MWPKATRVTRLTRKPPHESPARGPEVVRLAAAVASCRDRFGGAGPRPDATIPGSSDPRRNDGNRVRLCY